MITMLLLLLTTDPETTINTAPIKAKNAWFCSWRAGGASTAFSNSRGWNRTVRWVPGELRRCRCRQGVLGRFWRGGVFGRTSVVRRCSSGGGGNSTIGLVLRTDSDIARATIGATTDSWSMLKSESTSICDDSVDGRLIRYASKASLSFGSW